MEKYYYQEGLCTTLQYLSLNPVKYELENNDIYIKKEMACSCVANGKCNKQTTCQLFIDAPETMKDKGSNLKNNKL